MDQQISKNLRIQLSAVKRLKKDQDLAVADLNKATKDLQETEFEQGSFEYKNLVNLKKEAETMIKDSESRLASFKAKLRTALASAESFNADPLVIEARELLQ